MTHKIIDRDFFSQPTLTVARALLGQRLVRMVKGERLSGVIVESEAYFGPDDTANHASKGRTARTEVMFGPPGRTYVYLIYGMYYMLNLVTEPESFPAAVLIRALEPVEGLNSMRRYRQGAKPSVSLTNGPGKLSQALQIDKTLHNWDVTFGQRLWLEQGQPVSDSAITTGSRVGISYAAPKDQALPWRFWISGSKFVSR